MNNLFSVPELHVAGEAELATSLHVEGSQVHSETRAWLLEQVVGDLQAARARGESEAIKRRQTNHLASLRPGITG